MRPLAAVLFVLASALFVVASIYQWQAGRRYRAAQRRLVDVMAQLGAEAPSGRPLPTEWTPTTIDQWEREAKRTGKRPS